MRAASCFSGIGSPEIAMPEYDWIWHSEIDPFPCAVMTHRHPNSQNLGDILAPDFIERAKAFGPLDLLVGGPPCQAFSVAGLRQSLSDPRGNLTLRWAQVIHAIRPRIAITENVPGWLSTNDNAFGCFLAGIVGADAPLVSPQQRGRWPNHGMVSGPLARAAWRILDAQYCRVGQFPWAVPQRRRRVFVVIDLGDGPDPAAVLFDRESLRGNPAPRRKTGASVAALTANGVGTCGADDNQGQAGHLIRWPADVAPRLNAHFGEKIGLENQHIDSGVGCFVAHALRGEGFDASEDGTGRGTPLVPIAFPAEMSGTQCASSVNRAPALSVGHTTAVAFDLRERWAVRRLTPKECERLQGFPDDHTKIPWCGKPADQCPVGPRYKAVGNSMAVNVMRWIGERIEQVEALSREAEAA